MVNDDLRYKTTFIDKIQHRIDLGQHNIDNIRLIFLDRFLVHHQCLNLMNCRQQYIDDEPPYKLNNDDQDKWT